jgi:acyl-CoA thioesterase-1
MDYRFLVFVALGDSMTVGYQSPSLENPIGTDFPYTRVLEQLVWSEIRQRGFTNLGVVVENEGVNGDKIEGMITRFSPRVTRHKPNYIIIWAGFNDLNPSIKMKNIKNNLQKLYHMTRSIGAEPIACSLTPRKTPSHNSRIIEFNKTIQNLCSSESIIFVDLFNVMIDSEGKLDKQYYNDGHLSNNGYTKVAETIFEKAIKGILSNFTSV